MSKKTARAGVIGAVLGALAGVFLLAPKSAKENREDLKNAAAKAKSETEKHLKALYKEISTKVEAVSKQAKQAKGAAAEEAKQWVATGNQVLARIKEALSELHDEADQVKEDIDKIIRDGEKTSKQLDKVKQKTTK